MSNVNQESGASKSNTALRLDLTESASIAVDSVVAARRSLDLIYSALKVDNGDWTIEYTDGCQATFLALEEIESMRRLAAEASELLAKSRGPATAPLAPDSNANAEREATDTKAASKADDSDAGWCASLATEGLKFTRSVAMPIIDAMALNQHGLEGVYKKLEDATFVISELRLNLQTLRDHARAAQVERRDLLLELSHYRTLRDAALREAGAL